MLEILLCIILGSLMEQTSELQLLTEFCCSHDEISKLLYPYSPENLECNVLDIGKEEQRHDLRR